MAPLTVQRGGGQGLRAIYGRAAADRSRASRAKTAQLLVRARPAPRSNLPTVAQRRAPQRVLVFPCPLVAGQPLAHSPGSPRRASAGVCCAHNGAVALLRAPRNGPGAVARLLGFSTASLLPRGKPADIGRN
jgi:hypothetical protein